MNDSLFYVLALPQNWVSKECRFSQKLSFVVSINFETDFHYTQKKLINQ